MMDGWMDGWWHGVRRALGWAGWLVALSRRAGGTRAIRLLFWGRTGKWMYLDWY
ncbi:hypothetical protein BC567DRAFT_238265 [Phyllosticta citribraziliensis]